MSTAAKTTINIGQLEIRFLVEPEDSGGSVTVFECEVPAQARVPVPHSHDGFEETIYGLSGSSVWTVDGTEVEVGHGDCLCIRRGAVHGFENRGAEAATFLAIAAPGIFGPDYFTDVSEVIAAPGPPDLAAVAEVMRRHGLTPAPVTAGPQR